MASRGKAHKGHKGKKGSHKGHVKPHAGRDAKGRIKKGYKFNSRGRLVKVK